jgi:hypothetical protein
MPFFSRPFFFDDARVVKTIIRAGFTGYHKLQCVPAIVRYGFIGQRVIEIALEPL